MTPVDLLRRLVAIDSVNPDLVPGGAGESAIAGACAAILAAEGFEIHRLEATPGRPSIVAIARGSGGGRSLMFNGHVDTVTLAGYELLKAFPGLPTHDAAVTVPVVPNDQDIARMQAGLSARWDGMDTVPPGYLIRGHGSYVWAADMPGALARLEALEFMLACEMQERRMR